MKELRNKMIALGVVVALGAIGLMMNPSKAVGQGPPGGLAVNIVNPLPVPVRSVSEAFQPVFATGNCGGLAATVTCSTNLYTVPAGKRLVIEYFSATSNLPSAGDTARVSLSAGAANVVFLPHLAPATPSPFGGGFTTGGQVVKLYAGPSTVIEAQALRSTGASAIYSFNFAINGYLVNAP